MTFKREGDDASMLRNLQNRRVADLLANYIPDDEALLLSNGRLTCMVCSHRPIFDTLAILSIHRKGKKHIGELGKNLAQKRELDRRKLKIDLQLSLHSGNNLKEKQNALPTLGKRFVTTTPYSSCVKRNKTKFQGLNRRAALDVNSMDLNAPDSSTVNDGLPSCSVEVRRYLKGLWKKRSMEKTVVQRRENYGNTSNTTSNSEIISAEIQPPPSHPPPTMPCLSDAEQEEIRKQAQHEIQLRMSGWLKNVDGKWVKDPEVEFDSDEDEPIQPPD